MDSYYKRAIIISDTLRWDLSERPIITLEGKIFISDSLCLNVSKLLQVFKNKRGIELVYTDKYSYNLNYDGKKNSEVFRYDNFDDSPRRHHKSTHHYHKFVRGKEMRKSPVELQHEDVPTLGEAIEEAHKYYLSEN